MRRVFVVFAASLAALLACASDKTGRTKLADGSYRLTCKKPLADCLTELADVCRDYGYDVLRAREAKERFGVEPVNTEVVTSKATIRCRSGRGLLVDGDERALETADASRSAPVTPARCFPGTTQACLGPGACKGAQICKGDGTGFGSCDCGALRPSEASERSEASDAGPPPTWAVPASDGEAPP